MHPQFRFYPGWGLENLSWLGAGESILAGGWRIYPGWGLKNLSWLGAGESIPADIPDRTKSKN